MAPYIQSGSNQQSGKDDHIEAVEPGPQGVPVLAQFQADPCQQPAPDERAERSNTAIT
jgi:hypothetical protein